MRQHCESERMWRSAAAKLQPGEVRRQAARPVATVRDWEQHRRSPDAPARTLLGIVDGDPKAVMKLTERVFR